MAVRKRTTSAEHRILRASRSSSARPLPVPRQFFVKYARANLRTFPWRVRDLPDFKLLIAELLLVQTKAEDVAKIWPSLVKRYSSPALLAGANVKSLTRILRPLGLQNQRARALRAVASALVKDFDGQVPGDIDGLLSLPHVGLYAACALASFARGTRVPIVDANVIRVLGRITGTDYGRDLRRNKEVWSIAWSILPTRNHAQHNYGLLDFAAQICNPRAPRCGSCPLRNRCSFGQNRATREVGEQGYAWNT